MHIPVYGRNNNPMNALNFTGPKFGSKPFVNSSKLVHDLIADTIAAVPQV